MQAHSGALSGPRPGPRPPGPGRRQLRRATGAAAGVARQAPRPHPRWGGRRTASSAVDGRRRPRRPRAVRGTTWSRRRAAQRAGQDAAGRAVVRGSPAEDRAAYRPDRWHGARRRTGQQAATRNRPRGRPCRPAGRSRRRARRRPRRPRPSSSDVAASGTSATPARAQAASSAPTVARLWALRSAASRPPRTSGASIGSSARHCVRTARCSGSPRPCAYAANRSSSAWSPLSWATTSVPVPRSPGSPGARRQLGRGSRASAAPPRGRAAAAAPRRTRPRSAGPASRRRPRTRRARGGIDEGEGDAAAGEPPGAGQPDDPATHDDDRRGRAGCRAGHVAPSAGASRIRFVRSARQRLALSAAPAATPGDTLMVRRPVGRTAGRPRFRRGLVGWRGGVVRAAGRAPRRCPALPVHRRRSGRATWPSSSTRCSPAASTSCSCARRAWRPPTSSAALEVLAGRAGGTARCSR